MNYTDPTKAQQGEFLSEVSYYRVDGKNINSQFGPSTRLINDRGEQLAITDGLVGTTTFSASQFTQTEEVTATRLAEILSQVGDTVFSASFQKQPDAADLTKIATNNGNFPTNAEIRKSFAQALKGEERIIVARLLSIEALMGRAKVVDLEIQFKNIEIEKHNSLATTLEHTGISSDIRLIDLRHLNWIVYKGVKYIKKK